MSGTLSLNPATHARNLTLRARAFRFRHRAPIAAVAGAGATCATYGAAVGAAERLQGRGDDDAQRLDATSKLATLALSAGCVAAAATYLRARSRVDPERVHAAVMRRLERHPGLCEVLGAPLDVVGASSRRDHRGVWTSRDVHAPVQDAKVHMAFRVAGTRKVGLVTVEAKKRKAWGGGVRASWRHAIGGDPHEYALVAVDVAADNGGEHRVYLAGGSERYAKQGEVTGMHMREALVSVASEAYEAEQRGGGGGGGRTIEAGEGGGSGRGRAETRWTRAGGMWPAERVTDYVAQKRHEAARFVTKLGVADARK